MELSASQAAKKVGKSVPTITRAIKKGKLSAKSREGGVGWIIEASELFRVWPAVSSDRNVNSSILDSKNHALQKEISLLREMLDDTKESTKKRGAIFLLTPPEAIFSLSEAECKDAWWISKNGANSEHKHNQNGRGFSSLIKMENPS